MTDLAIEYLPLTDLVPYARNARTHSPAQVSQIAASVREFGWTNPVLIDEEGGIIAGHGRVMAAQQLGMDQVPCIRLLGLTKTQQRAYALADNRLALNAGWDAEMLAVELDELRDDDFDLDLLGFEAAELNDLIGTPNTGPPPADEAASSLAERFMIPPFSVLNAREGWWQDRKRAWLALGIKSELGRGGGLTLNSAQVTTESLNYYRNRQPQAAAPGPRATTAKSSAATGAGGR